MLHFWTHHIISLAFKVMDIVSVVIILIILKNLIVRSLDRATVRRAPPTSYSVSNHLRDLAQVELI